MSSKIFEYAIIWNPKETSDAQGNDTTQPAVLLQSPTVVLAKDAQQVAIIAARKIPEEYLNKLEEVDVCVRPF